MVRVDGGLFLSTTSPESCGVPTSVSIESVTVGARILHHHVASAPTSITNSDLSAITSTRLSGDFEAF